MAEPTTQAFSYRQGIAPMLWAFVALALVELIVVHLLLSHWSRTAALLLSVVTGGGIAWFVRAILSFRRLPVLITPEALIMRVGTLRSVTVPLDHIAGLRGSWDAAALKRPGVLNLGLIAYPNVLVDLREPPPGGRGLRAIAHRLDDPIAFAAALTAALR